MIGIDLIEIKEFSERIKQTSSNTLFLPVELEQNNSIENMAGIFAAKEAFFKAIGKKINWLDVWIEKSSKGEPKLFSTYLSKEETANVSITHTNEYAAAVVIIITK